MKQLIACAALLGALALPANANAQVLRNQGVGVTPNYQFYSFGGDYPISSVSLLLLPLAYQASLTQQLAFDIYGGIASGRVEASGKTYTMTGPVDTRVRVNWSATPWAVLTLGLNLPTGNASHDSDEAIVASVLSTDLFGFREASFGSGLGATTGVATARRFGAWGVGFGASYRLSGEFEPRSDTTLKYTPGNEARARLAIDRNVGTGRFTAGLTFQNYTQDKVAGRNLFQAGNRIRGDLSYAFRTGQNTTWTAYVTEVWRDQGDLTLAIVDANGALLRDSTVVTANQTLFVGGLIGAMRVGGLTVRPAADVRVQRRNEIGGDGWVTGIGGDVPFRAGSMQIVPAARVVFGSIESTDTSDKSLLGGEVGLTIRWGSGQ